MNHPSRTRRLLLGGLLIAAVPFAVVCASFVSYFLPREYAAKTTFEVIAPSAANFEQPIRAYLPASDPSIELLPVRNTGLFEILAYSLDPQTAASRANQLTVDLSAKLHDFTPSVKVRIWEKAEPPRHPSRPNIPRIFFLSILMSLPLAAFGVRLVSRGVYSNGPDLRSA